MFKNNFYLRTDQLFPHTFEESRISETAPEKTLLHWNNNKYTANDSNSSMTRLEKIDPSLTFLKALPKYKNRE